MANIKIELVKSISGRNAKHIATAKSLGLKKLHDVSIQPDNQATQARSLRSAILSRPNPSSKGGPQHETE